MNGIGLEAKSPFKVSAAAGTDASSPTCTLTRTNPSSQIELVASVTPSLGKAAYHRETRS